MRGLTLLFLVAGLGLAANASAQEARPPLGDLLQGLPPAEDAPPPRRETPPPVPLVRPPPPDVAPGRVGTTELPPSSVTYGSDPPVAQAVTTPPPVVAVDAPPAPTEADIAWQALQEERRQKVNAEEAPVVARLNAGQAAEQGAARLRAEQAQAEYEQSLADREQAIRDAEAAHQADLQAHEARLARQRADYEVQVAACLDGDRDACKPR